jgi:hypothetical protein
MNLLFKWIHIKFYLIKRHYPYSNGIVYLTFDSSSKELSFKVFLEGISHIDSDDVKIIDTSKRVW